MRGSVFLVLDTLEAAHATRRQLIEQLNFPPTLAFAKKTAAADGGIPTPSLSSITEQLPANVKLMTVSSNYQEWNGGQLILRLSHLYAVGEHPVQTRFLIPCQYMHPLTLSFVCSLVLLA